MNQLNSAFTLFLSLLVEAMPFLLLGVLFSGILQFFVDERRLLSWMPKNPFLGALVGSCAGFLFPVCECGNVPVARRLLMQGAPASVSIGFLLAAPTINPIVFWSTWTAFRDQPEIVFLRVGLSLAIATIIGWVFSIQSDLRPFLRPAVVASLNASLKARSEADLSPSGNAGSPAEGSPIGFETLPTSPLLQSGTYFLGQSSQPLPTEPVALEMALTDMVQQPLSFRLQLLLESMLQEMRELAGVLILGSAVAAALQVFVPRESILGLGQGSVSSIVAMMTLAGVVSICSTVDAFFALSFASLFTTGSLVAFLVFGPMIDLKGIGLLLAVFRPRAIAYLFGLAALMTFLASLVLNLYVS
jgi:uncharacterized protein